MVKRETVTRSGLPAYFDGQLAPFVCLLGLKKRPSDLLNKPEIATGRQIEIRFSFCVQTTFERGMVNRHGKISVNGH
jgi:hypothetical protein